MVLAGIWVSPLLGLLLFISPSLASSSPALLSYDPPLSHPGKFEVTPTDIQEQPRLRFVKRQNPSGSVDDEEEAALLALLDIVPRTARSSGDSLLVRLFSTFDLNEDGVIDNREFETVLRMVASLNRHPSFF